MGIELPGAGVVELALEVFGNGAVPGFVAFDRRPVVFGGESGQVQLADHRRNDVAVLQVVVVAGAVEVGRHDAAVVGAVLAVVALAELDAGDLGDGVGLRWSVPACR
jgi:hypothetical protein